MSLLQRYSIAKKCTERNCDRLRICRRQLAQHLLRERTDVCGRVRAPVVLQGAFVVRLIGPNDVQLAWCTIVFHHGIVDGTAPRGDDHCRVTFQMIKVRYLVLANFDVDVGFGHGCRGNN